MTSELRTVRNKVLLQRLIREIKTPSGIYLGEQPSGNEARVVAIGPGIDEVSVGDIVLYNPNAAHDKDVEHEGNSYFAIHINEIYGTINQEATTGS